MGGYLMVTQQNGTPLQDFYLTNALKMILENKVISIPICNWMIICEVCIHAEYPFLII